MTTEDFVECVQAFKITAGDFLVLHLPSKPRIDAVEHIVQFLKDNFPGVVFAILPSGAFMERLSEEDLAQIGLQKINRQPLM